jgi:phenylacetic acid degradation operon negative regulatory protein
VKPTAKTLVLDLLSTLNGRSMPVRALIAGGALFGIEENSLRVALARLLVAGTLERDERGEYRLGERAQAVQRQVVSWRRLEERLRPWQGGWIGVHLSGLGRATRSELRRRERALRFLGFRELAAGLEVRPANLAGGLAEVSCRLASLGLPEQAPTFAIAELEPATEARARALWNTQQLVARYRASRRELAQSESRLQTLPLAEAMAESFLLGGTVIRQLVYDPLLPEPIVPQSERRALIGAMERYDRLGQSFWRAFFQHYRVKSVHAPVDSKLHEASQMRLAT